MVRDKPSILAMLTDLHRQIQKVLSDMRNTGIDSVTIYNTSREEMQCLLHTITHTLKRLVRSSMNRERSCPAE